MDARQNHKTELTLEILDKAIEQIKGSDFENEIIGFKLNPADLRAIKSKTAFIWAVERNRFFITPPYKGVFLESDVNVPPGYPEAIHRKERQVKNG